MPKKTFTEEQILTILRAVEAGASAVETCRKFGITETTFYRWKRKYEGMGVAEMRRLRQLEEENKRLKQLVADLTLDKSMHVQARLRFRRCLEKSSDAGSEAGGRALSGHRFQDRPTPSINAGYPLGAAGSWA